MSARGRVDPPCASAFLFGRAYLDYDLGADHPLRPQRLEALLDLLDALNLSTGAQIIRRDAPIASDEQLERAHTAAYIRAVRLLSAGVTTLDPVPFGLGPGDTPSFPGMHESAATMAGGTVEAARMVMDGEVRHAFNPGGGLHHALPNRASGFCIYNDLVMAIADVVDRLGCRVLYVDFDVHHGDGVQAAFYDDPRVLTVSFHETGRYLFPGTGFVPELGTGAGLGYSVNVPLQAFTEDGSWLEAVHALLPPLVERFHPELIVSQHGCDGHVWDGQSHLLLTMRAYRESARLVHRLAHEHCGGRWLATGGGGYDPVRVVPRAWAAVWAEMAWGRQPGHLPARWRRAWAPRADGPMPAAMTDPPAIVRTIPRKEQIETENRATVERVRDLALSSRVRLAYRPAGVWTPRAVATFPSGRSLQLDLGGRTVLLRDRAPVSMLRRLRVAEDMHAFTRSAEREAALLRQIAARPEANLTVATTPQAEIVGEVTMAPGDGRWGGLDGLYEIAAQVARSWRHGGLARALLSFALEPEYVEELILIALGLGWHWDLEAMRLSAGQYRAVLERTFQPFGFQPLYTDDPDIMAAEGNMLLARIGRRVNPDLEEEFRRRLTRNETWYGF